MATRAPRPCRAPACRHLSRDGTGYCEEHQKLASGWNRQNRGSAHSRGYGAQWRKIRARVLDRDKHLCQPCRNLGRLTTASAVDHIINRANGGGDDPMNLQAICTECHKAKTQAESRGEQLGGCDTDGVPTSATHHWFDANPEK